MLRVPKKCNLIKEENKYHHNALKNFITMPCSNIF